jgi:hypothetical protein
MVSVAKPRCARGQNCSHIRDFPHIDKPPKVAYDGALCDRCRYNTNDSEVPEEYKELLRTAKALLDNGIENEDEIIPTLVLAANVGQMPHLEHIRDELAKAGRESKARGELVDELYSVSGGSVMSSGRVVDGVPLVQRAPFRISVTRDKNEAIEEIAFDVFKRSVTHEEVRKWYEWYLKLEGVDYDLNELSRGVVTYKTDNRKFFSVIARPEEMSVDGHGHILPIIEGVRKFPHPEAVAGLYHGLRDLIQFTEFPLLLAGRLSGPMLKPHNLVPACVGWYVADRGRRLKQRGALSQVTKILNEHLLAPRGEQPANSLARNIRKVRPAVLRFEHAIKGDVST